jgi:hypothetical protein
MISQVGFRKWFTVSVRFKYISINQDTSISCIARFKGIISKTRDAVLVVRLFQGQVLSQLPQVDPAALDEIQNLSTQRPKIADLVVSL